MAFYNMCCKNFVKKINQLDIKWPVPYFSSYFYHFQHTIFCSGDVIIFSYTLCYILFKIIISSKLFLYTAICKMIRSLVCNTSIACCRLDLNKCVLCYDTVLIHVYSRNQASLLLITVQNPQTQQIGDDPWDFC